MLLPLLLMSSLSFTVIDDDDEYKSEGAWFC